MNYTVSSLIGVAAALAVDLLWLRTAVVRRKAFWASYGIIVLFQLVVNGLLSRLRIVRYDQHRITGWRIVYAPVEDLLFGFAMVTVTLAVWVSLGRRGVPTRPSRGR
jgi:lycopene cyclase domain-containing protein